MDSTFEFRSPLKKLVLFFRSSRDKWKDKCKQAKRQINSLQICLARMKENRDSWKSRALAAEKNQQRPSERLGATGRRLENCLR